MYAGGKGAVNVTDVRYDERTQSDYVDVAAPVLEEGLGRFVGVVSALVDIVGLFSAFDQQQLGRTGRIRLVKGSGIIVNATERYPGLERYENQNLVFGMKEPVGQVEWTYSDRFARA